MNATEKHIAVLDRIVTGIGSMSMEYWTDRTEKDARAALKHLSNIARQAEYLRLKIGADDDGTLVEVVQKAFGCGPD